MKRLLFALLLAVPAHTYSQAIPFDERGPLASFTASAVNISHYDQNGHKRTLWGWSAEPEVNLTRRFGMQGDFAGLYMHSVYPGQNRFIIAGGPRFNFAPVSRYAPLSRTVPFLFAEAGGIKATQQYSPLKTWKPIVTVGLGFEYRLSRSLALSLVPEYLGEKEDDGTWSHSFIGRAGLTLNFDRLRW